MGLSRTGVPVSVGSLVLSQPRLQTIEKGCVSTASAKGCDGFCTPPLRQFPGFRGSCGSSQVKRSQEMKSPMPQHTCLLRRAPAALWSSPAEGLGRRARVGARAGGDRTVPSRRFLRSLRTSATARQPRLPPTAPLAPVPLPGRAGCAPAAGPSSAGRSGTPRGRAPQLAGVTAAGPPRLLRGSCRPAPP